MTDTSIPPASTPPAAKIPLGVGALISSAFSVMFGNFFKVAILGFIGAFIGFIINVAFLGFGAATGTEDAFTGAIDPTTVAIGTIASMVINVVVYAVITALLIQLAYDSKLGRQNSLGAYFKSALPAILPISVLSIVVAVLSMIGALALGIGALWVYAVFFVMAPVAIIERGGFGSMGRSRSLTKEYRWPIVGLFILIAIVAMVFQIAGGFLVGVLVLLGGEILAGIGFSIVTGLAYGFGGISVALVYARLREIKEGVDVDQIAAVFD